MVREKQGQPVHTSPLGEISTDFFYPYAEKIQASQDAVCTHDPYFIESPELFDLNTLDGMQRAFSNSNIRWDVKKREKASMESLQHY